jgi:hypothetical protein
LIADSAIKDDPKFFKGYSFVHALIYHVAIALAVQGGLMIYGFLVLKPEIL